jgi:hypothetical protein
MRTSDFLPDRVLWLVGVTPTCSASFAMPTLSAATPSLNDGLARSTIAVGAWYSRPSYQKLRTHASGSFQPQVKNEYQGTSRIRPRQRENADVDVGSPDLSILSSTVGSSPRRLTTFVSITPSRSTLTNAVASRNGIRTCSFAVSPGS